MTTLKTGRWHGDEAFELAWPDEWSVDVRWPRTPPPLTTAEIAAALRKPIGLGTLAEIARGKARPLVIIDDLSRPTPVASILAPLLDELEAAGIGAGQVTVLLATGTHPAPGEDAVREKVGPRAADACRVLVHVDSQNCIRVGRTRFGTPIIVDRAVVEADLLIGIGGVYPNNTAGFGGGSKLALGVLARESITHLHEKHRPAGWGRRDDGLQFRRDLDEIATAIGLTALVVVHVDADVRPVRVVFGDHRAFYADEVRWAAATYRVPPPGDADVVVANAYPTDTSLVGARQKGMVPLRLASPEASRVLLASCPRGAGGHGLFPLVDRRGLLQRVRRKASVMSPLQLAGAVAGGLRLRLSRDRRNVGRPVLLYRPGTGTWPPLPPVQGMQPVPSWPDVITAIRAQHPANDHLRVVVYPCAPLQLPESEPPDDGARSARSGNRRKESQR